MRELPAYGRLKIWCLFVAENMTKCPLTRGVRLREVSVSGGSTVLFVCFGSFTLTFVQIKLRGLLC